MHHNYVSEIAKETERKINAEQRMDQRRIDLENRKICGDVFGELKKCGDGFGELKMCRDGFGELNMYGE